MGQPRTKLEELIHGYRAFSRFLMDEENSPSDETTDILVVAQVEMEKRIMSQAPATMAEVIGQLEIINALATDFVPTETEIAHVERARIALRHIEQAYRATAAEEARNLRAVLAGS